MTNIYLITNKVTGQKYVGKTRNSIEYRFQQHCNDTNRTYIDNAIKAYGAENFELSLLRVCADTEWQHWEAYHIQQEHSHWTEGGYNLSLGGDHNPMEDEEVRKRHLAVCRSEEHRAKQRIASTGKRHSLESRAKMSRIQKSVYADVALRQKVKLHQPTRISVDMLDDEGNIIQTFDTLSDACRHFGKSNTNAGRLKEMIDVYNKSGERSKFWGYSWSKHIE